MANGIRFIPFLLLLLPGVAACSNTKSFDWREDVRLSDGRVIVVDRKEEYRQVMDVGAGFRIGWLFQRSSIAANLPAPINRKVSWEGSLQPLALDIQPDRTVYLVCIVTTGVGRDEWSVPDNEVHVSFHLTAEGWRRISLSQIPQSVQANLLGNTQTLFIDRRSKSGIHVDLKLKRELDSDLRMDKRFRTIVRPLAPEGKQ